MVVAAFIQFGCSVFPDDSSAGTGSKQPQKNLSKASSENNPHKSRNLAFGLKFFFRFLLLHWLLLLLFSSLYFPLGNLPSRFSATIGTTNGTHFVRLLLPRNFHFFRNRFFSLCLSSSERRRKISQTLLVATQTAIIIEERWKIFTMVNSFRCPDICQKKKENNTRAITTGKEKPGRPGIQTHAPS